MTELDTDLFNKGLKRVIIGQLTQEVIDFLNLKRLPCDIVLWNDRLKYIEKHKKDFSTEDDFYRHIKQIPHIINCPDYLGLHPNDNSIQYIKRIDEIMLVGIRIKDVGNLSLRSSYPISEDTLNKYIQSNTCWKYK